MTFTETAHMSKILTQPVFAQDSRLLSNGCHWHTCKLMFNGTCIRVLKLALVSMWPTETYRPSDDILSTLTITF